MWRNLFLSLLASSVWQTTHELLKTVLAQFVLRNCHSLPFFWGVLLWTHKFLFIWCFTISCHHLLWCSNFHYVPQLTSGNLFTCRLGTASSGCGCFPCCYNRISPSHLVLSLLSTCKQPFLQGVLLYFIKEWYLANPLLRPKVFIATGMLVSKPFHWQELRRNMYFNLKFMFTFPIQENITGVFPWFLWFSNWIPFHTENLRS